jgi:hypothetical protein
LVQIQTNMTHFIFKRVDVKSEIKREKRGKKREKISSEPIYCSSENTCLTIDKRMAHHFQCHRQRWHWASGRRHMCRPKSIGLSYLLASPMHAPFTFNYLIIFIFVKNLNRLSFKLIITKNPLGKYKNSPRYKFYFIFLSIAI